MKAKKMTALISLQSRNCPTVSQDVPRASVPGGASMVDTVAIPLMQSFPWKDHPMKTYKFKLYSNHGNGELHQTIAGRASVWNHCVALHRRYYAIYGKYISKFRLINHISKLKRTHRFAYWNQLPSQAIQDVVTRIDKGYKAMSEAGVAGKKWGRPRFKPSRKYKFFTLLQAGWKLLPGNRIKIAKRIYFYFKSRFAGQSL